MAAAAKNKSQMIFLLQVQNDPCSGVGAKANNGNGGRYTPLSALASLQPGGAGAGATGPRFAPAAAAAGQAPSTFPQHHFAPHQGK